MARTALGTVPLERLSQAHVARLVADLEAAGRGTVTIRRIHATLRSALSDTVRRHTRPQPRGVAADRGPMPPPLHGEHHRRRLQPHDRGDRPSGGGGRDGCRARRPPRPRHGPPDGPPPRSPPRRRGPLNRPGCWRGSGLARGLEPCLHLGSFDAETRARAVRLYGDRLRDHGDSSWPPANIWASCWTSTRRRCGTGSRTPRGRPSPPVGAEKTSSTRRSLPHGRRRWRCPRSH